MRTPYAPGRLIPALLVAAASGLISIPQAQAESIVAGVGVTDTTKVLGIDDYERWRSISPRTISDSGTWVAFGYRKNNAYDPEVVLHVKSLRDTTEFVLAGATGPQFSDDSNWLAYFVDLPFAEAQKLQQSGTPRTRKVQLMDLASGERVTWENAAAFQFSAGADYLAVKKAKSDTDAKHTGTDLLLRALESGAEQLIGSVQDFAFDQQPSSIPLILPPHRSARSLAYTVDAEGQAGNGLYLIDLASRALRPLDNDARTYSRLTWSLDGTALAVLKGNKPEGKTERANILLAFPDAADAGGAGPRAVSMLDPGLAQTFPDSLVISDRAALSWSEDLSRVFFGLDEQEDAIKKPEHPDRVANVNVWHSKDKRIQSVQMVQATRDRNFTFRGAYLLKEERFVRLTDETMRSIMLTRDGRWGVGVDERAYISDWKERQADYYRVDTATGERTLMLEGQKRTFGLSPDSRNFLYWRDQHFWNYELESGKTRNLTATAPVSFVNQEYDYPGTPPPYGIAAWTEDGSALILNHRYDLWLQPLDGSAATSITGGEGDERELRLRYVQTRPGPRTVDLQDPILLSAFGQWTKQAGIFRLDSGSLEQLKLEDRLYGWPLKAGKADVYLFTRETFEEFPDLWVSDGDFESPRRITEANPWQEEYRWGRRILFDYTNADGVRLQGTLAIPDDYVEGERRPMLVNFYEKSSPYMHGHLAPRYAYGFGSPLIEAVSKGYLVMQADIHFRTGNTHADMLECVEAATRKVIEMGYADPARIGLHGHSFSGQGSAYIAGTSKMFAAVAAGAAATDLLADFNHMWGWTPTNQKGAGFNAHRYDIYGQGRLGTNPYDDRDLYWRESATNHVRTMDVPLLLMHGTADGAVAIMEAVQFYNGLRFNDKNVVLLSYPGEGHGLNKLANRRDLTIRMQQFFDHYLRDAPAPDWMVDGVPFLGKEHGAWDRYSEK